MLGRIELQFVNIHRGKFRLCIAVRMSAGGKNVNFKTAEESGYFDKWRYSHFLKLHYVKILLSQSNVTAWAFFFCYCLPKTVPIKVHVTVFWPATAMFQIVRFRHENYSVKVRCIMVMRKQCWLSVRNGVQTPLSESDCLLTHQFILTSSQRGLWHTTILLLHFSLYFTLLNPNLYVFLCLLRLI